MSRQPQHDEPDDEVVDASIVPLDDDLVAAIMAEEDIAPAGPEEIQRRIVLRYLNATSDEELFEPLRTVPASAVLNKPLMIGGVSFNRGMVDGQDTTYAVIECFGEEGPMTVTCGAQSVKAQLVNLHRRHRFPMCLMITKMATKTAAGFQPLYLEPVWPVPAWAGDEGDDSF